MSTYIINTESVQNRWGHLLKDLTPKDNILAFFRNDCSDLTLGFINAILKRHTHIELISRIQTVRTNITVNFQLVTELGYRIAKNPDERYILVSENEVYDPLIEYWSDKNIDIHRYNIITSKPDDIKMSYNHRQNDELRKPLDEAQIAQMPEFTPTYDPTPEQPKTLAEPDADNTGKTIRSNDNDYVFKEIEYLPDRDCAHAYYVGMNKLHIPANKSKELAKLMVDIMKKPENQRMLGIYNLMGTTFGKKSSFTKTYYRQIKMLVAEINRIGPLPIEARPCGNAS